MSHERNSSEIESTFSGSDLAEQAEAVRALYQEKVAGQFGVGESHEQSLVDFGLSPEAAKASAEQRKLAAMQELANAEDIYRETGEYGADALLGDDLLEGAREAVEAAYSNRPAEVATAPDVPSKVSMTRRKDIEAPVEPGEAYILSFKEGDDPEAYADAFVAQLAPGVRYLNSDGDQRRVVRIEGDRIYIENPLSPVPMHTRLSGLRNKIAERPQRAAILHP